MLPVPWLRHGFSFVWVTSFFGWKLETTTDILQIGVTKASWGRRSTSGCSKNLTSHLKVNHESIFSFEYVLLHMLNAWYVLIRWICDLICTSLIMPYSFHEDFECNQFSSFQWPSPKLSKSKVNSDDSSEGILLGTQVLAGWSVMRFD